jgi:hypothetical protein
MFEILFLRTSGEIDFCILNTISLVSLSSNNEIKVTEHLYLRMAVIHLGKCFG